MIFFLFVWTLTTHGKFSDSGDEPHYLMVAESLVSDRDLDVGNNYARQDGRWFGADTLEAGPHARVTRQGTTWSTHDVGVPIVLAPIYGLASRASRLVPDTVLERIRQPRGLFAYSLVSLTLTALTAVGIALVLAGWLRRQPRSSAVAAAAMLAFSPPVLSHAFLVFPETLALFVVCAVVWICCLDASEVTSRRMCAIALAIGCLPWLHRKYSFLVIGLMLVVVHQQWTWFRARPRATWGTLAALALAPQVVLHAMTLYAWGNVGGPQMLDTLPFSLAGLQRGALGLLLDRERGLLAYAPIYLLLPLCWVVAWRHVRIFAVPIALLFVPMAAFAVWGAGFSPAARYLVPLMPLMAMPVGQALANRTVRIIAVPLVLFQALVTATVWQTPRLLWPKERGTNDALESLGWVGRMYERALPSMLTGDSPWRGWATLAVIAVVTAIAARACRSNALADRAARSGG